MTYVMSLEIDDFLQLVAKATQKRDDEKAWAMWLARYPFMTEETFESFDEFKTKLQRPAISRRPKEEILAKAEAIQRSIREKQAKIVDRS